MAPWPTFPIPNEIHALVKKDPNSPDFVDMMLKLVPLRIRKDPALYHLSFSTKLFLEEADEQHKLFDRYNINNVHIEHIAKDTFRFQVVVGLEFFNKFTVNKYLKAEWQPQNSN